MFKVMHYDVFLFLGRFIHHFTWQNSKLKGKYVILEKPVQKNPNCNVSGFKQSAVLGK